MNRASWAKLSLAAIVTAGVLSFAAPAIAGGPDTPPAPLRSSWG